MSLRSFAVIVAVLVCGFAHAQVEPTFRALGIAEGLPSNHVLALMQDRRGYLWMATQDGLARYDGIGFRVFRNDPADAESIPCNDVQTVFEDSQERLWLGCSDRGLSMLRDREEGRFMRFAEQQKLLGFDSLDVYTFGESAAGHLWLGTYRRGVLRVDEHGRLHRLEDWLPAAEVLRNSDVLELHVDSSGDLWLAATDGLWRIRNIDDPRQASIEQILAGEMMMTLSETAQGSLWIGGARSVYRIEIGAAAETVLKVPGVERGTFVDGIAHGSDGVTWLGTWSGLYRVASGQTPQLISSRVAVPGSLPANTVTDLLIDHEGGLWIGSRSKGIAYLRPDRDNFELMRHDALDNASLPPGRLMDIDRCPNGDVYLVTDRGLARLDPSGALKRIGETPRDLSEGRSTHGLMCDAQGALWLGRADAVTRVNPLTGDETSWGTAEGIVPGKVQLLAAGRDGEVWMSSVGGGISRIDAQGRVRTWQTAEQGIAIADFEQISVGSDGRVWLADATGLHIFDRDSDRFHRTEGGPGERVSSFALDDDETLWTASVSGLEQWRVDGFSLQRLNQIDFKQGLPAIDFPAMLIDPSKQIWLTSARGLWRVNARSGHVERMGSRQGLPDLQYVTFPAIRMTGDKVVALTLEGLLRFDPLRISPSIQAPPLRLASASVRRGDIRVDLDPSAAHWDLQWNDRDLRVEARVLSYVDPHANQYGFLLEEHDPGWVETAARPEREFSRIEAGNYRLRIRASNVAHVDASNELLRTLYVAAPPWFRWQAWVAYAVAMLLLIWWSVASWQRRIERKHRLALAEERRLAAESANHAKSDFLADVGHEIRTPMAGVLGMTDLLMRSRLDEDQHRWTVSIKRSGEHMLRLINDLLDLSRIEAGELDMSRQPVDLIAIIEDVRTLEAPLAEVRGIAFTTTLSSNVPRWIIGDSRRLKQIVLNLVNNALKFTEEGSVGIQISQPQPGLLQMQVSDTGPGMSGEQLATLFARFRQTESGRQKGGSGLGLAITSQLVRLLGGSIEVTSEMGKGACFSVRLPLEECAAPDGPRQDIAHADQPLSGLGVLVVEDDATLREVVARQLSDMGATVVAAPHALEALSKFQPGKQRIAVLDLDLPGIDGLQLLTLLRNKAGVGGLFAIAITARSASDTEQRCRDAGFDRFLRKPVWAEQLQEEARIWRAHVDAD